MQITKLASNISVGEYASQQKKTTSKMRLSLVLFTKGCYLFSSHWFFQCSRALWVSCETNIQQISVNCNFHLAAHWYSLRSTNYTIYCNRWDKWLFEKKKYIKFSHTNFSLKNKFKKNKKMKIKNSLKQILIDYFNRIILSLKIVWYQVLFTWKKPSKCFLYSFRLGGFIRKL